MGEHTAIAWTDHTFNPWIGCTRVSPGCEHCYAESWGRRFGVQWGPGRARKRTAASTWKQPLAWDRKAARDGVRRRVFCASLADVFDPEVRHNWRDEVFALAALTPNLDWLVLTKRPEHMRAYITNTETPIWVRDAALYMRELPRDWNWKWPLPNVWLGVTAEDQANADERLPILLDTPAAKRFVSHEPALGPVDWGTIDVDGHTEIAPLGWRWLDRLEPGEKDTAPRLDWIITGGESGPGARRFDVNWARQDRDQCRAAGVAFFMKQMGSYVVEKTPSSLHRWCFNHRAGGDEAEWPEDLRVQEFPA